MREQVVVCTKGGYLTFGTERPADPRRWIQETYVKSGLFNWEDFVAGCHCMAPAYIKNQVTPSKGVKLPWNAYFVSTELYISNMCLVTSSNFKLTLVLGL